MAPGTERRGFSGSLAGCIKGSAMSGGRTSPELLGELSTGRARSLCLGTVLQPLGVGFPGRVAALMSSVESSSSPTCTATRLPACSRQLHA